VPTNWTTRLSRRRAKKEPSTHHVYQQSLACADEYRRCMNKARAALVLVPFASAAACISASRGAVVLDSRLATFVPLVTDG
jgi:hypothetical protein